MYMYTHIYINICLHVPANTRIYTYQTIYTCMHTYVDMHIWIYVYVYVRTRIHMYTYKHIWAWKYAFTYTYACRYTSTYAYTCLYVWTSARACTRIYLYVYIYVCVRMRMLICIWTCMCTASSVCMGLLAHRYPIFWSSASHRHDAIHAKEEVSLSISPPVSLSIPFSFSLPSFFIQVHGQDEQEEHEDEVRRRRGWNKHIIIMINMYPLARKPIRHRWKTKTQPYEKELNGLRIKGTFRGQNADNLSLEGPTLFHQCRKTNKTIEDKDNRKTISGRAPQ